MPPAQAASRPPRAAAPATPVPGLAEVGQAPSPLENLHPALWRAHQLGHAREAVCASGFAELDAELPGGGWPQGVLTELLLARPGLGELRLLAPALAALTAAGRCVMLFDPPAPLSGWALAQLGVDARQLLVVHGREGAQAAVALRRHLPSADLLWALEQALRSGHLGAALAWLPARLPADVLRRLQLAAQAQAGPTFLFREIDARLKPSAAPLRLALQPAGIDELSVRLLKRRGPPLARPLRLWLPPVLGPEELPAEGAEAAASASPLRGAAH